MVKGVNRALTNYLVALSQEGAKITLMADGRVKRIGEESYVLGVTATRAQREMLAELRKSGVEVRLVPRQHAKLVLTPSRVVMTTMNFDFGMGRNYEAWLILDEFPDEFHSELGRALKKMARRERAKKVNDAFEYARSVVIDESGDELDFLWHYAPLLKAPSPAKHSIVREMFRAWADGEWIQVSSLYINWIPPSSKRHVGRHPGAYIEDVRASELEVIVGEMHRTDAYRTLVRAWSELRGKAEVRYRRIFNWHVRAVVSPERAVISTVGQNRVARQVDVAFVIRKETDRIREAIRTLTKGV